MAKLVNYCGTNSIVLWLIDMMQVWLLVLLLITARSQAPQAIAGGVALLTVTSLPPRLWTAQLKRLGLLALFLFVTTALLAGHALHGNRNSTAQLNVTTMHAFRLQTECRFRLGADGVPPVTQVRNLPPQLEGLPAVPAPDNGYRYVLFHFLFITVTRRSVQLAVTTACLAFTALQASMRLVSPAQSRNICNTNGACGSLPHCVAIG